MDTFQGWDKDLILISYIGANEHWIFKQPQTASQYPDRSMI